MDFKDIKVIVSDIDGTFVDDNKQVLQSTVDAIKLAKQKGYMFILCSGREPITIKKLMKKWNIDDLVDIVIGFSGAQIIDLKDNTVTNTHFLNENAIKDILDHFDGMDLNIGIPDNGTLYFPKENRFVKMLAHHDNMEYKIVDFNDFLNEPKPKLMIVTDSHNIQNVLEKSKSLNSKFYNGLPLQTGRMLVEYMDENVSKAKALEIALKKYNLSLDNVCSFGDADNDYDMILKSKIGVVMENGSPKTKSVANFITNDNNNHGIYNFLINKIK